jgi:hypothetical protein
MNAAEERHLGHREQAYKRFVSNTGPYDTRHAWNGGYDAALAIAADLNDALDSAYAALAAIQGMARSNTKGNVYQRATDARARAGAALVTYRMAIA